MPPVPPMLPVNNTDAADAALSVTLLAAFTVIAPLKVDVPLPTVPRVVGPALLLTMIERPIV